MKKINLIKQVMCQTMIYCYDNEDGELANDRIKLERYQNDDGSWDDWFIDSVDELDGFSEIMSERDVLAIAKAFKEVRKLK